ncbi:MAG TPA: SHOCT domain-containing protein [Acidimicrobiales bacterium]
MTRSRAIVVTALVVVASILLAGTAASAWVKRQALDTDNWVDASDELLADPTVQDALATYLVDQLYANVDVQDALADRLPEQFQGLAGPIAAGLRQPATAAVERLLATPQVQQLWHEANTVAHEKLIDVLEDEGTFVSTGDGTVTLQLRQIVVALGEDLGIPQAALDRIPPEAGNIELVQSDQLAAAQTAVKMIRWMALLLGVLIIGLYALALFLAKGSRRRTLRNIGWAIAVVGLLLLATRRLTGSYITSMVSDPGLEPVVKVGYAVGSKLLRTIAIVVLTWGIVFVLGAIVAGPSRFAVWARRTLAPVLNLEPLVVFGAAAGLYVLLLLWAPFAAFQTALSSIGLAVVLAVGIWLLRRRTLVEFPDSDLGDHAQASKERAGKAWDSVTGAVKSFGSGRRDDPGDAGDHADQLERLARLHDSGSLSDEEFATAKAKLLT